MLEIVNEVIEVLERVGSVLLGVFEVFERMREVVASVYSLEWRVRFSRPSAR
jgi:hypothetical protein